MIPFDQCRKTESFHDCYKFGCLELGLVVQISRKRRVPSEPRGSIGSLRCYANAHPFPLWNGFNQAGSQVFAILEGAKLRRHKFNIVSTVLLLSASMQCAFALDEIVDQDKERDNRLTIGLVLSGGGARGAAHVGVIKVLEELRIPVDYIAGTSMGAIVGGLYASGMDAGGLVAIIESSDWSALLSDRPPRSQRSFRRKSDDNGFLVDFDIGIINSGLVFPEGFIQGQNLEIALKRMALPVISIDDFDDLPIPFRAIATDIVSGEAVILNSGDLATAMRASMSAPGIFKPVRREGRILVDGGVANNLPVQVVRDMGADVLIVVDVGFPLLAEEQLDSALGVTRQMLTILINARAQDQIRLMTSSDILISPNLGDFGSQDFQQLAMALRLGEEKAEELSADLARLVCIGK